MKVLEKPKLGHYPIALIPGQFTDHYRTYSSNQLKYFPLNTATKTAPVKPKAFHMAYGTSKLNDLKRQAALSNAKNASKRPRSDGGSGSDSSSSDSSSDDDSSDEDMISSASETSSDESDVGIMEEKPQIKGMFDTFESFTKPIPNTTPDLRYPVTTNYPSQNLPTKFPRKKYFEEYY